MKLIRLSKYRETLFLFSCTLYIFARILSYSLYSETAISVLFNPVFLVCYLGAVAKIALDLLLREYRVQEICIIGIISIFLFFNMQIIDNRQAFIYWVFIVASKSVDYRKIMKWAAIAHFAALTIVIGSCYIHVLENILFHQRGQIRESLGFTYATQPANFCFYAVLLWIAARGEKISFPELTGLALVDYWLYVKTATLSAFVLTLVVLGTHFFMKLLPAISAWRKGYRWIAMLLPVLAAGSIIFVSFQYDPSVSWMNSLDQLLHTRLTLGHAGIEKYGIPLFGQYVDWIGTTREHISAYNYVDSSFVQTLVNYGWVFFVLLIVALVRFGRAIADHRDTRLLFIFSAALFHAMFDPQLIWIMFNSLWLAYGYTEEKTEYQMQKKSAQNRAVKGFRYALAVFFVTLIAAGAMIPSCAKVLNKALLLNKNLTGYSQILLNARTAYTPAEGTEGVAHLRTWTDKMGFGEIIPEDIQFFVQSSKRMHPDISRATICFSDGTGIEIPVDDMDQAEYGILDELGRVSEGRKAINLSEPLGRQIEGITTYQRERDAAGNVTYQFHMDADGNGIADSTGAAGFRRTYDMFHHVLTDQRLGVDNHPVVNTQGYAEVHREYVGEDLIRESYYDAKGDPILTTAGYAEVHREYTGEDLIRESYYDAKGDPVLTTAGYAAVKRVYDSAKHVIQENYFDETGAPKRMPGGFFSIAQEWEGNQLISRTYLNADGANIERTDGYASATWIQDADGIWDVQFVNLKGEKISLSGLNLGTDLRFGEDGWSAWMRPTYNIQNSCMNIGYLNLGSKKAGDIYTCQIEIEFKDVTATEGQDLRFWAQGAADGKWNIGNVWDGSLISLSAAPEDGVYAFTTTVALNSNMAYSSRFDTGFRCDYWASGMFRVKNVKIEKGDTATEWTPGI